MRIKRSTRMRLLTRSSLEMTARKFSVFFIIISFDGSSKRLNRHIDHREKSRTFHRKRGAYTKQRNLFVINVIKISDWY